MLKNSKSLFVVTFKSSYTTEKRLMINLAAAKEAYKNMEISDIGFTRNEFNCAEAFKNVGHCESIERVLLDSVVDQPVE